MYSWNNFKNLPKIKNLPIYEQNRQYFIYQGNAMYESIIAQSAQSTSAVSAGGSIGNKFTIISNDIQFQYLGSNITSNGSIGFTTTGTDNIIDSYVNYAILNGFNNVLSNYWTNNNLVSDNSAYIFNITWEGAGSSISSGKVRMSFYNGDSYGSPGYYTINICTIDTSNNSWMDPTADPQALGGTFNFPATLTLYSPTILSLNQAWC